MKWLKELGFQLSYEEVGTSLFDSGSNGADGSIHGYGCTKRKGAKACGR
jgi:hypothetical protein